MNNLWLLENCLITIMFISLLIISFVYLLVSLCFQKDLFHSIKSFNFIFNIIVSISKRVFTWGGVACLQARIIFAEILSLRLYLHIVGHKLKERISRRRFRFHSQPLSSTSLNWDLAYCLPRSRQNRLWGRLVFSC